MIHKHLYFIECEVTGILKIGISKNPEKRLRNLQSSSPTKLKLRAVFANKGHWEQSLHKQFNYTHSHDEWFYPNNEIEQLLAQYECINSLYPEQIVLK